jgi:hypothetical protein
MVRRTRPQMRNCTSGNFEILRCAIAHRSSLVSLAPRNDRVRKTRATARLFVCKIIRLRPTPTSPAIAPPALKNPRRCPWSPNRHSGSVPDPWGPGTPSAPALHWPRLASGALRLRRARAVPPASAAYVPQRARRLVAKKDRRSSRLSRCPAAGTAHSIQRARYKDDVLRCQRQAILIFGIFQWQK